MTLVHFVIPGDLDTPTGGYAYDRAVLEHLPTYDVDVRHLRLPGSFPFPSMADLAETARLLAAVPAGDVLLIDGLAHGVLTEEIFAGVAAPVVALHHHPLGLETGLSEAESQRLLALEKAALAQARHVIVSSNTTAETLRELGMVLSSPITVALPGTPDRPRAVGTHAAYLRAGEEKLPPPFQIISVGSIIPRKGYDILIDALARLPLGTWRSSIAGSLELDPACAAAIKAQIDRNGLTDHVTLTGALNAADMAHLYSTADIYCLPSRYEGYGMAFASALRSGLPIIAAHAGAVPETVPPHTGVIVPVDDTDALTDALIRMMTDGALRERLSEAAWTHGQTLPRWSDTAAIIARVLHGVAEDARV